ncbi:MAG: response regulator transcription factor, partial [Alphaproteobacteria bacterium]|nr:response regulator transcription factor [Alphaproteobacteria bacterium]
MALAKRVLLVDDDAMLRSSLAEQLAVEGDYSPVEAANCAEARTAATDGLYEFIILDVGLPDGDGRRLAREFRDQGITCPILMLTAADSDEDTISGLQSGANDYVTKPFRFSVLMARAHAHLRSHTQSEDAVYRIGPYTFRPSAKTLLDGAGKRIRLTEKETNILKFLH